MRIRRGFLVAMVAALVSLMLSGPMASSVSAQTAGVPIETSGTINGVEGLFEGVVSDLVATQQNGETIITGVISGAFTTVGGVATTVNDTFSTALDSISTSESCDLLSLGLGPVDLNVAGVAVHLDSIALDITADGGLLGSLICTVGGLASAPLGLVGGLTGGITGPLNSIFGLLG